MHAADGENTLRRNADRVESLLNGFDAVATPRHARELAEELARTVVALYGAGLERVLALVYDAAGDRGDAILERLTGDPFVEGLLCVHGLHPLPVEERVQRAIDGVRPYLRSHEGDIAVVSVIDGVVTLRLQGSCDGCPSSAATVRLAIERAIRERVPEIIEVRAENVTAAATPSTLRLASDWIALAALPFAADGLATAEVQGTPVLFARLGETLVAYRNHCAVCTLPLDGAVFAPPYVRCAACGTAYDAQHAGRSAGVPHLEPFPLVRDGERIRLSIPLAV